MVRFTGLLCLLVLLFPASAIGWTTPLAPFDFIPAAARRGESLGAFP